MSDKQPDRLPASRLHWLDEFAREWPKVIVERNAQVVAEANDLRRSVRVANLGPSRVYIGFPPIEDLPNSGMIIDPKNAVILYSTAAVGSISDNVSIVAFKEELIP